jgi:ribosomal protein S18 acetylase RimI-like enzyme
MNYLIREAEQSDLEALISFTLHEATETEGVSPDLAAVKHGVQAGLDGSAPSSYWVAEDSDGSVVGSISVVTEWSNFRGGYYWWIQSLFIVPEHRGRGLVDYLLEFVATTARAAGALDLRLYVLQSNQRAIAAYRRCGFDVAPYTIMIHPF